MLSKLTKPGVIAVVATLAMIVAAFGGGFVGATLATDKNTTVVVDSPDVTVDNNIEAPPATPEPAEESHEADGYEDEDCWDCAEEDIAVEDEHTDSCWDCAEPEYYEDDDCWEDDYGNTGCPDWSEEEVYDEIYEMTRSLEDDMAALVCSYPKLAELETSVSGFIEWLLEEALALVTNNYPDLLDSWYNDINMDDLEEVFGGLEGATAICQDMGFSN